MALFAPFFELIKEIFVKDADSKLAVCGGLWLALVDKSIVPDRLSVWINEHAHIAFVCCVLGVGSLVARLGVSLCCKGAKLFSDYKENKRIKRVLDTLPKDEQEVIDAMLVNRRAVRSLDTRAKATCALVDKGIIIADSAVNLGTMSAYFKLTPGALKQLYKNS